jgi:hypothetical protein
MELIIKHDSGSASQLSRLLLNPGYFRFNFQYDRY